MEILFREEMKKQVISMSEFEQKTVKSRATISNIERGQTSPTLEQLEAFAQVLHVKITDLFDSPYK